jgi:hypothetical protein
MRLFQTNFEWGTFSPSLPSRWTQSKHSSFWQGESRRPCEWDGQQRCQMSSSTSLTLELLRYESNETWSSARSVWITYFLVIADPKRSPIDSEKVKHTFCQMEWHHFWIERDDRLSQKWLFPPVAEKWWFLEKETINSEVHEYSEINDSRTIWYHDGA